MRLIVSVEVAITQVHEGRGRLDGVRTTTLTRAFEDTAPLSEVVDYIHGLNASGWAELASINRVTLTPDGDNWPRIYEVTLANYPGS
jgi:hypothetical protein